MKLAERMRLFSAEIDILEKAHDKISKSYERKCVELHKWEDAFAITDNHANNLTPDIAKEYIEILEQKLAENNK